MYLERHQRCVRPLAPFLHTLYPTVSLTASSLRLSGSSTPCCQHPSDLKQTWHINQPYYLHFITKCHLLDCALVLTDDFACFPLLEHAAKQILHSFDSYSEYPHDTFVVLCSLYFIISSVFFVLFRFTYLLYCAALF